MPWIKVAKIADIPEGEIHTLSAGGKKVALTHIGPEFFAIDDICTHAQCSLGEGSLIEQEVECPCHGSRFDVKSGAVRFLPATLPIATYPVKVEGEDILVEI
jgi:nitrite reductase/ring-hydroxylating ferredoxin subunit